MRAKGKTKFLSFLPEFVSGNLWAIYTSLQDEESRVLFRDGLDHFFDPSSSGVENGCKHAIEFEMRRPDPEIQRCHPLYRDEKYLPISAVLKRNLLKDRKAILVDCHTPYTYGVSYPLLKALGIEIDYFCDKNPDDVFGSVGFRRVLGIPIISWDDLLDNPDYARACIFLLDPYFFQKTFQEVNDTKIQDGQILISTPSFENQYYGTEILRSLEDECMVDCGLDNIAAFDHFAEFAPDFKKYWGFEANPDTAKVITRQIAGRGYKNVEIINKGVWSSEKTLNFYQDSVTSSSRINGAVDIPSGGKEMIEIDVTTIDSVIGNEKVTLIKMDIEGSELAALYGAMNTIKNNKPRLAISVYHNSRDIIDILVYLKNLVPKYKFYIRQHYYNCHWERVLYAVL
jgi:FkbM family methyltransferase